MHSPTDDTVDIDDAQFVALEGSDHLLVARGSAARAARIISAWADQYFERS